MEVGTPKTLLIVDDEPGIRSLLKGYLSKNGFEVIAKQSGREALEHVQKNGCAKADVLLTDIHMPEIDGLTLARRITGLCPGIRVVLMSGFTDVKDVERDSLQYGWVFVPKPFPLRTVLEAIHAALQSQRASDKR